VFILSPLELIWISEIPLYCY